MKLRLMMLQHIFSWWQEQIQTLQLSKQTRAAPLIGVAQIGLGQLELRLRLMRLRLMMLQHIFSWWQS